MFPQLGTGSPTPRPKNDNVTSARMYCGASNAAWVSDDPDDLREHVPPQKIEIRCAEAAGRDDVVARAGAQHEAANQPGRARPPDEPDHHENQQKSLSGSDVEGQGHADGKQQIQPGQRQKQLCDAHVDLVNPSPVVTRQASDHRTHPQRQAQPPTARRTVRFVRQKAGVKTDPARNRRCRAGRAGSGCRFQRGANPIPRVQPDGSGRRERRSGPDTGGSDPRGTPRHFRKDASSVDEGPQMQPSRRRRRNEGGSEGQTPGRDSGRSGRPARETRRRSPTGTRGRARPAPMATGARRRAAEKDTRARSLRGVRHSVAINPRRSSPAAAECVDPPNKARRRPAGCRRSTGPWSTSPRPPRRGDPAPRPPRAAAARVRASS